MKAMFFLIVIMSAVYAAKQPSGCSDDNLCHHKAAGSFAFGTYKNYFYTCDGHGKNKGCQKCGTDDLVYSEHCDACISGFDAKRNICPEKTGGQEEDNCGSCVGKVDGSYQAPHDNTKYFTCVDGEAKPCQSCPSGLVYSVKCNQCLNHESSKCSNNGGRPGTASGGHPGTASGVPCRNRKLCKNEQDGDYQFSHPQPANSYYSCSGSSCTKRECAPTNTFYSKSCGACVYKDSPHCYRNSLTH